MGNTDRIWLDNYESGIPHDVKTKYTSIMELLENSFKSYPSNPAFTCMGKTLSYSELEEQSKAMAAYFQNELKLKKGDRIAIMLPNVLQYPIALMGALRAGLVVVNVNPLYTARELEHQLNDSGAETIVILANFANVLQQVVGKTKVKNIILTELGDCLGFPKSLIVNFVLKYIKKMVPNFSLPGAIFFNQALIAGKSMSYTRPDLNLDDMAFLQYTGGTTGVSKGAVLNHSNIVINVEQASTWISNRTSPGKDVIITALPLYHIFSLTANCFTFSALGAENVLIPNPRDIPGFVKELAKHKFTAFTGVNTLFNALLANKDFAALDFSNLRCTLGGGMAVQKPVAEKWMEITGQPLIQAYGLTETSPAATMNPFNVTKFNGTIGLPISSTFISIRDDDGKEVAMGEPGEIWIKGPQVMQGYWNRPEETAKVMSGDWFKSGDIGTMDAKGFVTIVDRKKDMILVSGFNVFPNEIEEVVVGHPEILEAAAIGVPDEKSGEAVRVYCVKTNPDSQVSVDDLIAHCRESLTGYKVPKQFEFRDELPKTNVGKILRRALRDK